MRRLQKIHWVALAASLAASPAVSWTACSRGALLPETSAGCSEPVYRRIEAQVPTGDGRGHGPDVGSEEWKSVVEFKLGIRDQGEAPSRDSDAWCRYIDRIVLSEPRRHAGPSFACTGAAAGSVEGMVCEDEELSTLDRKLSEVYAAASAIATPERPPTLAAEQRGWIKGRDECWKSNDPSGCVETEYVRRIAELQARYRLVPFVGPVRFTCDANPANEVVATFFETEPPTLVAERGDSVSVMFLQPAASGSRYRGRNESFWEHHGEATIRWGHGAPEMRCKKTPFREAPISARSVSGRAARFPGGPFGARARARA